MMKKNGFTLVELLLCIGIIGVVTAMGMLITKRSADSAYNLYYYTGYINLYNAIADARTIGLTSNSDIIKHANDILSSKVQTKETSFLPLTQKCSYNNALPPAGNGVERPTYNKNDIPTPEKFKPDLEPALPPQKPEWYDPVPGGGSGGDGTGNGGSGNGGSGGGSGEGTGSGGSGNGGSGNGGSGNGGSGNGGSGNGGSGNGNSGGDGGVTATTINTSNGITYTCSSNDNNNYFEIIMTIPQRKTRQNNGTASTRFIYYNENGGLLIPVASANANNINLQERNDLLPTYIDNGIVGRAVKTSSSYKYDRPAYYSYREAYCRLNNNASLAINGETVISCAGLQTPTASEVNSGFLKVANPRKAR